MNVSIKCLLIPTPIKDHTYYLQGIQITQSYSVNGTVLSVYYYKKSKQPHDIFLILHPASVGNEGSYESDG